MSSSSPGARGSPGRCGHASDPRASGLRGHAEGAGPAARPAIFLDRDGTLSPEPNYYAGPEALTLIEGAGSALGRLRSAGYALAVVTNQTAVGHGRVTVATVAAVNRRLEELLDPFGAVPDGVYCCYECPDAVVPQYRTDRPATKPRPTLLRRAARDLGLDLGRSYMVGDRLSDLEAGCRAGCRGTVLVLTGDGSASLERLVAGQANCVAADLAEAGRWILGEGRLPDSPMPARGGGGSA